MNIFESLRFSFGGGLLFFDKAEFIYLTINNEDIAEITIETIGSSEKEEKYQYKLDGELVKKFEDFAYSLRKRYLYPCMTDVAHPNLVKTTKDGKRYYNEFYPKDIMGLLKRFLPENIFNKIYEKYN